MGETVTVARLERTDKEKVVEVLAAAFHDYPVMRFALRDAGPDYGSRLRAMVDFWCESRFTRDWPVLGLSADRELVAAALLSDPVAKPWPPELDRIYTDMVRTIGPAAHERLERYASASHRHQPGCPHYYLGVIGVRPERQGRGHARVLLDAIHELSASDPASTGVCLSTEDPMNVALYRHVGYGVIGEADADDLHTWCMFRPDTGS